MNTRAGRRVLAAATFAVFAAAGIAQAVSLDHAAGPPTELAVRVPAPDRTVVIGDSAIAAIRWVPGADNAVVGFPHTLDLESCRRLWEASCFGREGRRPASVATAIPQSYHRTHDTLVVATGYNDRASTFAASFDAVVRAARTAGIDTIVWFTLRSGVDYVSPANLGNHETFATNNATLRGLVASGDYPDVVIADWGGYSADEHDWFVTDGVHYRQLGAWAASDYLTRKIAFLEERACPFGIAPSIEPENPCPDPDVTGPVTDVGALYPIGEDGVLCYEIGADRRVECRFDTHVIRLERELRFGDNGTDVSALQTRLDRLDLMTNAPNGNFGPATEAAVRAFQSSVSLPATGVADVATLGALGFDTDGIVP